MQETKKQKKDGINNPLFRTILKSFFKSTNKMKRLLFSLATITVLLCSCKKELEIAPKGVLSPEQVANAENIDKFAIAAYSPMGNGDINVSFSIWQYGDVRADDAY